MNTTTPPDSIGISYPQQAKLVHLSKINRENRSRQDYGGLAELWQSIKETGLIHPPTLSKVGPDEYILIAGGRRTAAMELGGLEWIPVIHFGEMAEHEIAELEGIENFQRKNMDWKEIVLWIARVHTLKKDAKALNHEKWGMVETGQLMGVSSSHVSHCYQVRSYIEAGDPEICAAPNIKAAYDILLGRREREANQLLAGVAGISQVTGAGFANAMDIDALLGEANEDIVIIGNKPKGNVLEQKVFPLSQMLFLGDSMEIMPKLNAGSVDHVVTDIPYGIDVSAMEGLKNIETVAETHEVEQNVSMMLPFLREAYRLLKPDGYCVFWYDLDHHEKLQAWATEVGFHVQRWPLVWHKLHPCQNLAAKKNWTKNVEFAMVCRKGLASLTEAQASCIVTADNTLERRLYSNPFAKPAAVWQFIYKAIAYKGQIVFDPFMGQMSSLRCAIDLGLTPMGIEIDKTHYDAGFVAIVEKLKDITQGNASFT